MTCVRVIGRVENLRVREIGIMIMVMICCSLYDYKDNLTPLDPIILLFVHTT